MSQQITPVATLLPAKRTQSRTTRGRWPYLLLAAAVLLGGGFWFFALRSTQAYSKPTPVPVVSIDRGDITISVVESGTLESTNNATVKCQVEALIGTVGGTTSSSGSSGRSSGGGSGRSSRSSGGGGGLAAVAGLGGPANKSVLTARARSGVGGVAPAAGGGAGGAQPARAPNIRSFSYSVTPHVPLRPRSSSSSSQMKSRSSSMGSSGFGGGGGDSEQKGSTRILTILPEGTPVKEGDVVCTLDSAALEDELMAQQIRNDQARAWVQQATALLEVNEISQREYNDGILPQDRALIAAFAVTCDLELKRCQDVLDWSKDAFKKGLCTPAQVHTYELNMKQAEIQRKQAETMRGRLEDYTAPRLVRNLEAKSASIRSDLLAQEQSLKIESDRLKRLQKMIDNCVMKAPRDGIVVYANQTSGWGRTEAQIREGVTVRERQPIFNLPDPNKMSVRVKINESKIAYIHSDQQTEIVIDAFSDHPVSGTVLDVTVIPTQAMGPISDVKVYSALVRIDSGGFEGLRPGMSAQVSFHVEDRKDVIRIPVGSLRWIADQPYAAKLTSGNSFDWVEVELGKIGPLHAEVLSGLEPGDRVAANPMELSPPDPTRKTLTAAALPSS